jgi:hypothetical protein
MKKFSYDFALSEENEKDAESKMQSLTKIARNVNATDLNAIAQSNLPALAVLASNLTHKELEKLAYMLKHDPIKTAMAKKALGV